MTNNKNIEYLKKSPIFASSLGSKELFHSNIWAYLIEQKCEYLKVFFKDYDSDNDKPVENGVQREKFNMDPIVETESRVFIIENKIKSLPRKEQLDDYEEKIKKEFSVSEDNRHFYLTGITKDEPEFLKKTWKYVSYKEISEQIKEVTMTIPLNEETRHFRAFALEYAEMINNLSDLLAEKERELKDVFYFPQYYKGKDFTDIRKKLRIDDILQKINADNFTVFTTKQLESNNILGVQSKTDYTRQRALSEFWFKVDCKKGNDEKNYFFRIGVQIQNTQFRWFVETNMPGITEDVFFDYGNANDIGWFAKMPHGGKISVPIDDSIDKEKDTKMRESHCFFKFMFVYQYFLINGNECSIDNLATIVIRFMKKAETIKDAYAKKVAENRR